MKDIIVDIVKQTAGLGTIECLKITGTPQETAIAAIDPDKTVVINAKLHNPSTDFVGEFGMGNLSFLNGVCSMYSRDGATASVTKTQRNGVDVPEHIIFNDTDGNSDKYRLMSKEIVDAQIEVVKFKGAKWDVTFEPTKAKVQELAQAASIYGSIEPTFTFKAENGNLMVVLGSDTGGSHFGKRTFANNVGTGLRDGLTFPLTQFLSILKLGMSGVCAVSISNQGACQISVDTGIGLYNYILPALTR